MRNLVIIFLFSFSINVLYAQEHKILEYLPNNYVKDGSVDYTDYIQKCLDDSKTVLFPNFPILINDKGLHLRDQQEIIFQKGSKLILKPSSKSNYALIHINNISNVTLRNIRLEGDRDFHKGETGEWGMGVDIRNSQNITIQNAEISKCWGDGIYIAGKETANVLVQGGVLKQNRRNGVSIISGDDIHLKDILIEETKGTWPMSAIDIEPNSYDDDYLGKILIENLVSRDNPRGISVVLSNYLSENPSLLDIKVVNFKSTGDEIGIKINPFVETKKNKSKNLVQLKGDIQFNNVTITKSKRPILVQGDRKGYSLAPNFVFKDITITPKTNFNLSEQFSKFNTGKLQLINLR